MSAIVLDNSVVLSWCLEDEEAEPLAEQAMHRVNQYGAVVPGIWWHELRNALVMNERRGRLSVADTAATLADLYQMRISVDQAHDESVILALARAHHLSVYEAAYLEVAQRRTLPIASLDRRVRQAAADLKITILG